VSPKSEAIFARENAALARTLRRAMEGVVLPEAGEAMEILDLACGTCREAETLISTLRDLRERPSRPVRFVGVDIRDREVEEGAARTRAAGLIEAESEFLVEDCSKLTERAQLGRDFDVTFLRHQNYWNDLKVWRRIFEQGLTHLKEDGLLVITSYFDKEHQRAVAALEDAGAELVRTVTNDESRIVDAKIAKTVDRHVAVFRKRPARLRP
jgi:SAM-dependent methyltransferase